MGDRYDVPVTCPDCGIQDEAYYAPTCGFLNWECRCGHVIDLEKLTGITHEDASNMGEMLAIVENAKGTGGR